MALLSLLISFIGKKLGDIVQAVFGWSVTALFGRLPQKKEIAVSVALLLAIAWPIFLMGLFLPHVAAWVLAFLPTQHVVGPNAMRIVWGALALFAPLLVGGLTHWAAPSTKGSMLWSMLNGYPLSLGYLVAFLVTVVTVPLIKLASIVRSWSDEHVYIQPRVGLYNRVLHDLAESVARAGVLPCIEDVPLSMSLSTKALKLLARGMVTPIVAEDVKCIKADGLELYLYPADLLLRGTPEKVALVRAMMHRTSISADAYLVASTHGQGLQDELGRLADVITEHEHQGFTVGKPATRRLIAIWHDMNEAKLPYEEWVLLESIARGLERRLAKSGDGEAFPLDREGDGLEAVAEKANQPELAVAS